MGRDLSPRGLKDVFWAGLRGWLDEGIPETHLAAEWLSVVAKRTVLPAEECASDVRRAHQQSAKSSDPLTLFPEKIDAELVGSRRRTGHHRFTALQRIDAHRDAPLLGKPSLEIDADVIERQQLFAWAEPRAGAQERRIAEDADLHAEDELCSGQARLHFAGFDLEVIDRQTELIHDGALDLPGQQAHELIRAFFEHGAVLAVVAFVAEERLRRGRAEHEIGDQLRLRQRRWHVARELKGRPLQRGPRVRRGPPPLAPGWPHPILPAGSSGCALPGVG